MCDARELRCSIQQWKLHSTISLRFSRWWKTYPFHVGLLVAIYFLLHAQLSSEIAGGSHTQLCEEWRRILSVRSLEERERGGLGGLEGGGTMAFIQQSPGALYLNLTPLKRRESRFRFCTHRYESKQPAVLNAEHVGLQVCLYQERYGKIGFKDKLQALCCRIVFLNALPFISNIQFLM